jgi:hypothetical protein
MRSALLVVCIKFPAILRHARLARRIGEFKCSSKSSGNAREVVSLFLAPDLTRIIAASDLTSKSNTRR